MRLDRNFVQGVARLLLIGTITLPLVLLSGCSFSSGIKRWSWSEEVALSSGEVIVVDRWEDRRQLTGLVQRGDWVFVQGGIRIKPPHSGTQPIVFEEWRLEPRVLDVTEDGKIYLVVLKETGAWYKNPPPPEERARDTPSGRVSGNLYGAFQWVDGAWMRILLVQLPPQTQVNLLLTTSQWVRGDESIDRPVVTLARKRKLEAVLDPHSVDAIKNFRKTLAQ